MTVLRSEGAGESGGDFYSYKINQSLRFNDGDAPLLHITPGSAGSLTTWTYSCWVKRSTLGSYMGLLAVGTGDGSEDVLKFEPNNTLNFRYGSGSDLTTSMLFRDVSAWYHIVVVADTTQSQNSTTASDSRLRFYVNGSQITDFSATQSYASQNFEFRINTAAQHYIGEFPRVNGHLDGYLAEVNFIDGTAYDASNFGETIDGVWVPKDASGLTFGTNGFYLPFDDSSAIGDDESSNTNDLTVVNLAATDVVKDSPTNNFCTLSYIDRYVTTNYLNEGALLMHATGVNNWVGNARSTFQVDSGKWYWEVCGVGSGGFFRFGIRPAHVTLAIGAGDSGNGHEYYPYIKKSVTVGGNATYGSNDDESMSSAEGVVWAVALDMDNGTLTIYRNNTSLGQMSSSLTGQQSPTISSYNGSTGFNFGQDSSFAGAKTAQGNADGNGQGDFYYAPPSGFLALCTANLPDPTIGPTADTLATDNFNTVLYTGNNATNRTISGFGFNPDWNWLKSRSIADNNVLTDILRGTNHLHSNTTAADSDLSYPELTTDGIIVSGSTYNNNNATFASWAWKAGGSGSSNSDGSITSSVSANTAAGFSIVSYTGNGTNGATFGHGLSSKPQFAIIKNREASTNWIVYVETLGATKNLVLEENGAAVTSATRFNNTEPTSTLFSLGTTTAVNGSSTDYIAYIFHSVEGYSRVGSYTGNSNADGTFVFTGFRPAWIMIKCTSASESWNIFDTTRDPSNLTTQNLNPNVANAESDASSGNRAIDILSNGFKCRGDNSAINNGSYIYLAFAETPFKFANAR